MDNIYTNGIPCPTNINFLYTPRLFRRGGIIPFMVLNGITYVLLGLSKEKNPVWADLGGRAEGNETLLQNALREYKEESRNVLLVDMNRIGKIVITDRDSFYFGGNINKKNNNKNNNYDQAILFIEVDPTLKNIRIDDYFQKTIPKTKYEDEMTLLRWIPYTDFLEMKNLSRSLKRVRDALLSNFCF